MPHSKLTDLPAGGGGRWPLTADGFRSEQWGDLEVGFTTVHEPLDCSQLYGAAGLPGGVCQCPHYGYIFTGSLRAVYPGTDIPDEVATAGEAYFIPAGHVLIYDEPTTALEFNPAFALQQLMDSLQKLAAQAAAQAAD